MKRLLWIDISKGLAILFVVYFHFFRTVFEHYQLPAADWSGLVAGTMSILRGAWWQISGLGFHAVGAFIVLSGWTLMQSTMRRAVWREIRSPVSNVLGRTPRHSSQTPHGWALQERRLESLPIKLSRQ